ncbi:exonuclease SbcCD subunit D C-terminal domain-containing protein [Pseudoduganella sp. GCM10020061]|uniref:exonuclease SbcCD subunit D C-terminal domain-containing protein n=1 Tax=Pseudoduganella sp. GCM10020061 TaxID=3317345 RepID=UPI003644A0E6
MRILHTSDWHLGQALHHYDRSYEHQCFLDWLVDQVVEQDADALLVAGDVFDNANPPASAQKQLYQFLQRLHTRAPRLDVVIIAGNHDSPARLEAPGPLLELHNARVVGAPVRTAGGEIDIERMLVPLHDRTGAVAAWCIAIPFLRPGDVPRADTGAEGDPYLNGIALLYRQAFDLAMQRRTSGQAIVAMGHCHMLEGQSSVDSERRIVIGGTEALPATIFDPCVAYAALGHLHLAQRVGRQEHLRYSGSPLPMSFSEVNYQHQVLRVDLEGPKAVAVDALPVPRCVQLLRVPEHPAPVEEALAALEALALDDCEPHRQPYLEVRVLLERPEPGLRARIEAAIKGKPVRLAKIEPVRKATVAGAAGPAMSLDELAQLQPDDIFRRLYQDRFGEAAPPDQLSAFHELMGEAAP